MYKNGEADGSEDFYVCKAQIEEVKDGKERPLHTFCDRRRSPGNLQTGPRMGHNSTAYGPVSADGADTSETSQKFELEKKEDTAKDAPQEYYNSLQRHQ